jgi:hypothetical protein
LPHVEMQRAGEDQPEQDADHHRAEALHETAGAA